VRLGHRSPDSSRAIHSLGTKGCFYGAEANWGENKQPAINAWEAVRYMAAGVMAHKSALRDGEVLEVPDWGDAPE